MVHARARNNPRSRGVSIVHSYLSLLFCALAVADGTQESWNHDAPCFLIRQGVMETWKQDLLQVVQHVDLSVNKHVNTNHTSWKRTNSLNLKLGWTGGETGLSQSLSLCLFASDADIWTVTRITYFSLGFSAATRRVGASRLGGIKSGHFSAWPLFSGRSTLAVSTMQGCLCLASLHDSMWQTWSTALWWMYSVSGLSCNTLGLCLRPRWAVWDISLSLTQTQDDSR